MRTTRFAIVATALLVTATLAGPSGQAVAPTGPADDAATAWLSVYPTGDGVGTVTSDPAGIIECGDESFVCYAELEIGTQLTLTATAGDLSTFDGWSEACSGTAPCELTIEGETEVRATFDAAVLDVELGGDGDGAVTSDPAGIVCDEETFDCWERYPPGTQVTLTAAASAPSVFVGWSGACSGTGTCVVTVDDDVEVVAEFDTAWLAVEPLGDGDGLVTSEPAGIECSYQSYPCRLAFAPGTTVTLNQAAADDSAFTGWGDACAGTGVCEVVLDSDQHVTARFDTSYVYLQDLGDGTGTVISDVGDLNCPPACLERYRPGTEVTLTATPEALTAFDGWTGHCTGTATTCHLVLTADKQVKATFDTGRTFASYWGDGKGVVTSTPAGISCPGDCYEEFHPDTEVTLVAEPTDGKSAFVGWIGDCSGTGPCVLDAGTDPYAQAMFDSAVLTVDRTGLGYGTVSSVPSGIDCGEDCKEGFAPGGTVTLTAAAEAGSTFAGWSGACSGSDATCELELDEDATATAQFNSPGTGGKIAYECAADICVMNDDGTGHTNITNTPWAEYEPTLSPDGTRIAFMTSDGLPDNPDRNLEIAVINIDGTGLSQVTVSDGSTFGDQWNNYDPDWSPDGTKLAFITHRTSNPSQLQVYTINVDGTGETMITDPSDQANRYGPKWSPDGTKIAYTTSLGKQDVYVMDADGSNPVNLTADDGWWSDGGPAWSPDGTRVAFTTTRWYEELTHNTDIMVIQSDGTGLTRVTDVMAIDEDPTWSPDGEWIAFSSPRVGGYDIWAVQAPPPGGFADGVLEEQLKRLTTAPGADLDPFWSGDGSGPLLHALTVKKTGTGKGKVTSTPTGIRCGSDCVETFAAGSLVTLVAEPAAGAALVGWSQPCASSGNSCTLRVDEAKKIKVRFGRLTPTTSSPVRGGPIQHVA